MAEIIRTERAHCLWIKEATFGTMITPNKRFGIHDTVVAPDPEYRWTPNFGIGSQDRNRQTILRGPQDFRGSIPDIRLQGGTFTRSLMAQILGRESGNSVLEGVSATDGRLPSMTMQIGLRDTSNTAVLLRNYYGGKVNRASLSASEGEELRCSLEELLFLGIKHNRSGVYGYDAGVTTATDPGLSDEGRWIFSGASINFAGQSLCRVRRFNLSIDNQLEYRYYLCSTAGGIDHLQLPNDIVEGKRIYRLEIELDLGDPSTDLELFDFLMLEGAASTSTKVSGLQVTFTFQTQAADNGLIFTINCSPSGSSTTRPGSVITSAKHNIPAPPAGLVPVTMSLDVNSVALS